MGNFQSNNCDIICQKKVYIWHWEEMNNFFFTSTESNNKFLKIHCFIKKIYLNLPFSSIMNFSKILKTNFPNLIFGFTSSKILQNSKIHQHKQITTLIMCSNWNSFSITSTFCTKSWLSFFTKLIRKVRIKISPHILWYSIQILIKLELIRHRISETD